MQIQSKIKKWGNSYGIPISKKVVEEMKLMEDAEVTIEIKREKPDLMKLFGIAKTDGKVEDVLGDFEWGKDT